MCSSMHCDVRAAECLLSEAIDPFMYTGMSNPTQTDVLLFVVFFPVCMCVQLDTELTTRHELQVEFKKMEGDYEQKVQELSSEKEALRTDNMDKEKENKSLCGEIDQLKEKVSTHITFSPIV